MTAFVANTNILELVGLKDAIAGTFIDNANVQVTVKDFDGVPVAGQTWPQTMSHVSGSPGLYRLALEDDLALEPRAFYHAHIKADSDGRIGFWKFLFKPQDRTS